MTNELAFELFGGAVVINVATMIIMAALSGFSYKTIPFLRPYLVWWFAFLFYPNWPLLFAGVCIAPVLILMDKRS